MNTTLSLTDLTVAFYAAVLEQRVDDARAALADDVVLHVPGHHPLAGDHHGPDGLLAFLDRSAELAGHTQQTELVDLMAGSRHVGAYVRVRAERPGRAPLDNLTVHVLRFEDGRIADIRFHNWDDDAVSAFWG